MKDICALPQVDLETLLVHFSCSLACLAGRHRDVNESQPRHTQPPVTPQVSEVADARIVLPGKSLCDEKEYRHGRE